MINFLHEVSVSSASTISGMPARPARPALLMVALVLLPAIAMGVLVYHFEPLTILAALISLGILVAMFLKPEAATVIVLFAMYSNLTVVGIYYHDVPAIVAASFFLLLGLPLLNYTIVRGQRLIINRILVLMALYFIALLASALFSDDVARSMSRVIGFVTEGLVLYFLVVNAVRTPKLLHAALWTIVLAGAMMGSLSLYQGLTGHYEESFGGLAQLSNSTIRLEEFGVKEEVGKPRVAGPIGEQNRYAQVLVVLLPIALSMMWVERKPLRRALAGLASLPILAGVLLTFSRGAFVTVIFILLALMYLHRTHVIYFMLAFLVLGVTVIVALPEYTQRISSMAGVSQLAAGNVKGADGSIRGRATENLGALHIFLANPVLGVGPGQTRYYMQQFANEVGFKRLLTLRRAHSMYLEEIADTGLVGFTCFMAIVAVTIRQLAQARRHWKHMHAEYAHMATGLMLGILAYLMSALFLHLSYQRYYWLLLAIAGAAIHALRNRELSENGQAAGSFN